MGKMINLWARGIIRARWLVMVAAVLLGALAFLPMQNLYYDNANERFFLEDDPNFVAFNRLLDLFGDIEYLSVGIEAPAGQEDVFHPDTLQVIDEITRFFEERPEVTQVRSLSKYQYTHSEGMMMATDDLIEEIDNPDDIREARDIIQTQPMAIGSLITEDLRHTRIAARVRYQVGSDENKVQLTQALREFIDKQNYSDRGYDLRLSGQPVFAEQFKLLTKRDQAWINPTMAVVMIIILFISFRSLAGMLLPWVVIGSSIIYVTGIQGLMHWPHSVVESALIPALIIIGVGISVHVLVEFYHARAEGMEPPAAATATIERLWIPALYTALTTAAGFLALSTTNLVPVKEFAWLGAIGAMTLFIVAMTLLPALLSFVKPFSGNTRKLVDTGLVTRVTAALPAFTHRYRKGLLSTGLVLLVASIILLPGLEVDSNFITYFKKDNPTRADLMYFDDKFNGIMNIDMMIDSGEESGIHEPAFLQQVESLQAWLEEQPEVGAINSLVDFHKEINQALNYDDPAYYTLPDSREMAAQFLLLYDNTGPEEDLTDAKDFYERYVRISAPITNMPASETQALLDRIHDHIARDHSNLDIELSGALIMYNAQDIYINEGMSRSFMIALVLIGISFIVLFRSLKYGLIALIPSIVPILITGGLLVVLGIPLNLGTMIVGAMTMGIAVDDAIHVMNRYLASKRAGKTTHESVTRAMTESGRAVVFTSIVLVTGFSVMLLGSFIPYIYTGLFAATIMALALLGDLLFLPALLYLLDGKDRTTKINNAQEVTP